MFAQEITRAVHETIRAPIEYTYVLVRETTGSPPIKASEALPDYGSQAS